MLPKRLSTGVRYMSASQRNTPITITQPNTGQATNGTPNPETIVATTWANVAQWRNREVDKTQTRSAQASYKITIRYPTTYGLDGGMNILVRGQRHFIDSFSDEDGQRIQLSIWTYVENDVIICNDSVPWVSNGTPPAPLTIVALSPSVAGNFTVAHGMGSAPLAVTIQMTSGGEIWLQSPIGYDATSLYLVASDHGITGNAVCF